MAHAILPMTIDDYDEVSALWKDEPGIGQSLSDSREMTARILERNPGLSLIARDTDGRIVGAVLCSHDGLRGYMRHLVVARTHRKRGIGRSLVDRALARLTELGLDKCTAFFFEHNEQVWGFYERLGWIERRDLRIIQRVLAPSGSSAPSRRDPSHPLPPCPMQGA
jgi:ribosomal protein S18 acetylase RimI-like enzyme